MSQRDLKTQIEQVVGRFWIDRDDPEVFLGYIDLGVFGRIKNCKLFRSKKRAGKESSDSDFTIVIKAVDTPIGLMRYSREMIEKAIYEDPEDDDYETVAARPTSGSVYSPQKANVAAPVTKKDDTEVSVESMPDRAER